jgi:hypothetical protein
MLVTPAPAIHKIFIDGNMLDLWKPAPYSLVRFKRLQTSGRPGIWEGQTAENSHELHFLVDLDSK